MVVDFRLNGKATGSTIKTNKAPNLKIKVKGQRELEKIEVVRNSEVIKEYKLKNVAIEFEKNFTDEKYKEENEVLYYYIRATHKNNAIAWSSPVWVEKKD